ncbi:MAG: RNA polymerase sigma-70 factor [Bacteroidota bacterium]
MEGSDINLVKRLKEGDKDAYVYLYESYYADLCLYASKYVKDISLSEEIVQDVIFNIWEKRKTLELPDHIRQYLYRAVHNRSLNYMKHAQVEEKYRQDLAAQPSSGFSDDLVTKELEEHIKEAIKSLPGRQREIFELSRFHGLKYREIAEKTGISVKGVEYHMTKALEHLSDALKEYLPVLIPLIIPAFSPLIS